MKPPATPKERAEAIQKATKAEAERNQAARKGNKP